jgi:hypothetical protein
MILKVKPGYKTSEFWFTLVSFLFSGLYLLGLISENSQKEELISIVSHAVESVILISGQVFLFYRYMKGRTDVKQTVAHEEHQLIIEEEKLKIQTPKTRTAKTKKNTTTKKLPSKKTPKKPSSTTKKSTKKPKDK